MGKLMADVMGDLKPDAVYYTVDKGSEPFTLT